MIISWIDFHGRSAGLAEELGVEAIFLPASIHKKRHIFKYVSAARFTWKLIRDRRPESVIVMLPPAPLLLIAELALPRGSKLVADLHTGYFADPKWQWFSRIGLWILRKDSVIVTNQPLAEICRAGGARTFVLHDILKKTIPSTPHTAIDPYILCPLSYANDEPVDTLLDAARSRPELNFIFTGKAPSWVREAAPTNVTFSGFVSVAEYNRLLADCSAVVAVTDRDNTMQRAGYEALMAGKPQVTAGFEVLREFLEDAAAYVDPHDSRSISEALKEVSDQHAKYAAATRHVLERRITEQQMEILSLRRFLGSGNDNLLQDLLNRNNGGKS